VVAVTKALLVAYVIWIGDQRLYLLPEVMVNGLRIQLQLLFILVVLVSGG
jgi:hypothetical protein